MTCCVMSVVEEEEGYSNCFLYCMSSLSFLVKPLEGDEFEAQTGVYGCIDP